MFIFTAKLRRKRIIAGIVALVLVCGALAVYASSHTFWGPESAASSLFTSKGDGKTNEDRIAYLKNLGWTVEPEPILVEDIKLPDNFEDDFLVEYLEMQTDTGDRLQEHSGKTVKRYTYAITNYPTGEGNIYLTLLIYKNNIIGGDVFSADTGELLHGLTLPSTQTALDSTEPEHSQPNSQAQDGDTTQTGDLDEGAATETQSMEEPSGQETLVPNEDPVIFE